MNQKVSIIILNWNGYRDTAECLESLKKIKYSNHNIIVVDNGSTDGSPEKIEREHPEVRLIRNKDNLGFAEGNNVGIRAALADNADHVLLLNNDTIVDENFLAELVGAAENHPQYSIFGPKIFYYADPTRIWFAGGMLSGWTGRPYMLGKDQKDGENYSQTKEVDFITGCAMMVRRDVLENVGSLDADYFNNVEDVDFCLRASSKGYRSFYVPASVVYHKVSSAMGGIFTPFHIYYQTRNILLFNKKQGIARLFYLPSIWFSFGRRVIYFALTGRFGCIPALILGIYDHIKRNYGKGRNFLKK